MSKDSFVLYTRYAKHIKKLNTEQRGVLLTAIFAYNTGEDLPEMDDMTDLIFGVVIEDIELCNEKWEETRRARAEAGRKGGLARQSKAKQSQAKPSKSKADASKAKQNEAKPSNANHNVYVNVNGNVNVSSEEEKKEKKKNVFTPPSVEEVRAYCTERRNGIDPEAFVAFYESKGWMVGKNRMKDWKASVRTWEKRNGETAGHTSGNDGRTAEDLGYHGWTHGSKPYGSEGEADTS